MNPAHIHIVINHIPIVALPLALIFLIFAQVKKQALMVKFSLAVIAVVSALILPVYLSGEGAEHHLEKFPVSARYADGDALEEHEESAEATLTITLLAGLVAVTALVLQSKPKLAARSVWMTVAASAIAIGSMGYTANKGGAIKHPEAFDHDSKGLSLPPGELSAPEHDDHEH
jgi:hypothetical protein